MSQSENSPELPDTEAGFITHLLELRDRLLRIVIFLVLVFAAIFPFANDVYNFLATPLLAHMPQGSSMIAVEVISPFLTPLKMAMYASLMLGMPYLLYQMWSFVAPGLYQHEKRLATPLLISSVVLFYAGVAFAYFIVFPLVFGFLVSVAPEGVAVMTDINKYLDFVLALFFAFGLAFEVPVATIILIAMGITTAESLTEKRPYIIVGAFVIGMLLTPPDVISQIMLALPMWLLFEGGIIMSRILIKPRNDDEYDDEYAADLDDSSAPGNKAQPATAAAAATVGATAGSAATTTEATEAPAEETTPTGYSAAAYPDDYEPLTSEEMDDELDKASEWDDEDDDSPETEQEDNQSENKLSEDESPQREPVDEEQESPWEIGDDTYDDLEDDDEGEYNKP